MAKNDTIVIAFGRFTPPTIGHEALVKKINSIAKEKSATTALYTSHTQDKKKNPLSYDQKIKYLTKAFGKIVRKSKARTLIEVVKELSGKYDNLVVVVGSDRVADFERLLLSYNGKAYDFKTLEIASAGERDPDAEGISGMSASKLRKFAAEGDFETFAAGVPDKLKSSAKDLYNDVRAGLGIAEELDEVLSVGQRKARGRLMKRYAARNVKKRMITSRRKASTEKLQGRAAKKAKNLIKNKLAGSQNYADLSPAQKIQIDKKAGKFAGKAARMAKKLLPAVRKAENERMMRMRTKKEEFDINESFESFLLEFEAKEEVEEPKVTKKRYHRLLDNTHKPVIDKRFKIYRTKEAEFFEEAVNLMQTLEEAQLEEAKYSHFVYQKDVSKTKEVVHRGTEESCKKWIETNAIHYGHKGRDFVIYKGTYPNVKPRDAIDFNYIAENILSLEEITMLNQLTEEPAMDKILDVVHKHVSKGTFLGDIVDEIIQLTGFKINRKEIMKSYIKKFGDPHKKPVDIKTLEKQLSKFGKYRVDKDDQV